MDISPESWEKVGGLQGGIHMDSFNGVMDSTEEEGCMMMKDKIDRWAKLAGPNGRFRRRLMNEKYKGKKYIGSSYDGSVIRQVLLHWKVTRINKKKILIGSKN